MGYAFATKMLVDGKRKVRFMYRELVDNLDDSGWRFFCGDEEQGYMDDPDNVDIYDIQTIIDIDKDIVPYLHSLAGSAFERGGADGGFVAAKGFGFGAETEK